jgi:hypothetical protein
LLEKRLERLHICGVALLLVQTLEVLGVVLANRVVAEVSGDDPDGLVAIDCTVVAPVIVVALEVLACEH